MPLDAARHLPQILPNYAYPPVVEVTLALKFAAAFPDNVVAAWSGSLGPGWQPRRRSSANDFRDTISAREWETVLCDQLLSVDAAEFRFAWDGRAGDTYPHYERIRDGLFQNWDGLCDVCRRMGQTTPSIKGWQVRYSNRIPQGTVWKSLADCSFCRLLPAWEPRRGLEPPQRFESRWQFSAAEAGADLEIEVHSTRDDGPLKESCVWIHLDCRGGQQGSAENAAEAMDAGRELVVTTFRGLMTPEANEYWGLK
ncbi:MAG: hypothetical protein SFV23_08625 [Planctomycetaceae bacterium]|nr:hypothetical protein [Planctomycetaceae bacterium]